MGLQNSLKGKYYNLMDNILDLSLTKSLCKTNATLSGLTITIQIKL
ncbi:MAG: hypothetical protein HOJ34_02730 [Kordiimonadaceae bacterium]|jgi:hypothetical protein|nr:hypothetical protein [Kordiimonadaceae bacterium]MBT6328674.1 hypothetical protein [Kordiimonadaceae bacterium]MBT7583423.1 hypothetical protein [Kordiimonadaceae bacterium]